MDTEQIILPSRIEPLPDVTPEPAPAKTSLPHLYSIQTRLDRYANMPFDDDAILRRITTALLAEAGEALQAMKSSWAWWPRGDTNPEQLREEIVDMWFFTLALLDAIETNVRTKMPEEGEISVADRLLTPISATEEQVMDLVEHLRSEGYGMYESVTIMLQRIFNIMTDGPTKPEIVIELLTVLLVITHEVELMPDGFLDPALGRAYLTKAAVNIERWQAAGTIPEELQEEANEMRLSILDDLDEVARQEEDPS